MEAIIMRIETKIIIITGLQGRCMEMIEEMDIIQIVDIIMKMNNN